MSLKHTLHTQYWNSIPKKCKGCLKAIYTIEEGEVYYQCSLFGTFRRDCEVKTETRQLKKPEEILGE